MAQGVAQASVVGLTVVTPELNHWPLVVFRMPRLVDVKTAQELGRAIDKLRCFLDEGEARAWAREQLGRQP